nr:hypothetical protein [Marinitenerispora sediminis]
MATRAVPLVIEVAREPAERRTIPQGGVLADNPRAIAFYGKNGGRRTRWTAGSGGTAPPDPAGR